MTAVYSPSEGQATSPTQQLSAAVEHALRAPSVHNTQPWRWHIDNDDGVVELYADRGRHLSATDPEGRDLLISCGAALDHLVVALAHEGLQATIRRFPDPENSTHLATVTVGASRDGDDAARAGLFRAIHRRHTDRRRFSHRPVPPRLVQDLVVAAARADVLLVPVQHARERFEAVLVDAADRQRLTPGYPAELQIWTRRYGGARDGSRRPRSRNPEQPQLVVRIGWPATHAAELPETPRRDLASVLVHGPVPAEPRRS